MRTKHLLIAVSVGAIVVATSLGMSYRQIVVKPIPTPSFLKRFYTPSPIPRVGPSEIYPRSDLTPGAVNPDITQSNIRKNICAPTGVWSTKSIRPPTSYTTSLKIKQIKEYGFADTNTADYEEDHLISLEIGGHPTDPRNLWPESYKTQPVNAHNKDKVENQLHKEICAGAITLKRAQEIIVQDWYACWLSLQSQKNCL